MSESKRTIRGLDIKLKPGEEKVLRVIFKIHQKTGEPVDFEEIRQMIGKAEEKVPSKVWIYKIIRSLKERGFIVAETFPPPSKYIANIDSLNQAVGQIKVQQLKELEDKESQLMENIAILRNSTPHDLAIRVLKDLSGALETNMSVIVQGINNVRQTFIREICDPAKEGDTIRVTQDIGTIETLLSTAGPVEQALIESALRGVKVKAIMAGPGADLKSLAPMTAYFENMSDLLLKALQSGNIQVRVRTTTTPTYRMVSLNDEKMVLILTSVAHPDTVAVVTSEVNPFLVHDAVRSFDEIWEAGLDFSSMFSSLGENPH